MIRVTVEVWPGGNMDCRRVLGIMNVVNESDLADVSDYSVRMRDNNTDEVTEGKIKEHRRADGWLGLVTRAFETLYGH